MNETTASYPRDCTSPSSCRWPDCVCAPVGQQYHVGDLTDKDIAWGKSQTTAEQDFRTLVSAVRIWVDNHMDQWEKFKYEDQYGPLYVTISRATDYPDSFDPLPVENHHEP